MKSSTSQGPVAQSMTKLIQENFNFSLDKVFGQKQLQNVF